MWTKFLAKVILKEMRRFYSKKAFLFFLPILMYVFSRDDDNEDDVSLGEAFSQESLESRLLKIQWHWHQN